MLCALLEVSCVPERAVGVVPCREDDALRALPRRVPRRRRLHRRGMRRHRLQQHRLHQPLHCQEGQEPPRPRQCQLVLRVLQR